MDGLPSCHCCQRPAWYRDRASGVMLCVNHARLEVRAARAVVAPAAGLCYRASTPAETATILALWLHFWSETEMDCFDRSYRAADLPALLACDGEQVVGLLSYAVEPAWGAINIVALNVLPAYQGQGVATRLLTELENEARQIAVGRLIVATANDNPLALYFYQRAGFQVTGIQVGIIEPDGPEDSLQGMAGIPVRDEIRLQRLL